MIVFEEVLDRAVSLDASDIHLRVGLPPILRVDGALTDLGEELLFTFQEIQLGRKRSDALRGMARRVRQVDLTATLNSIVQAEELGVSIAQLLRIQGDTQRAKRFAMAEKQANEAPVKIIIPVVLFILPAVFIILMGPLIKMTLDQMR